MAMTPESVEKALDEVRPYLIADGGNVEVWCPPCPLIYVYCILPVGNAPYPTLPSGERARRHVSCGSAVRWCALVYATRVLYGV